MRDAAKVPELGVDKATIGMDSVCDLLPAGDLLGIPDTRSGLPLSTKQGGVIS